jgi:hypothetical protein
MENMFEKGCLAQLSASVWRATRKIKPEQLPDLDVSNDWLNATKKLVDPDSLKPINRVVTTARSYLAGVSLPFPIHGMAFVPKEMIARVDGRLEEFKADFNNAVDDFLGNYETLREVASVYLAELFNDLDYPVDVRSKFAFAWRFVILDVPNGNTGILVPEVYEGEKEKFVQTMEEAREMAIQALRNEFADMVSRITERFTTGNGEKPKIFKKGTVNNFYEFFETFRERNIFKDDQLSELVERAQSILGGQSADSIRSNDNIKERIREGMGAVEKEMAEIFEMPRRKITLT